MTKCLVMAYISADDVLANFAIDSLNQLRRAAGPDIAVKALFNPTGSTGPARYYSFDGSDVPGAPLKTTELIRDVDMTDGGTLTTFVDKACGEPDQWDGRRHCLIFWGHGTELLLDKEPDGTIRYLTPAKLRAALEQTKMHSLSKRLDIVAFDACSMSMIELASELHACANFMIASQEEVPDTSFPYEQLLPQLSSLDNVIDICKKVPELYKEYFQDYLITSGNGMKQTTLSSLYLDKVNTITIPLTALARALRNSTSDSKLVDAIIAARNGSRDFVLGIFVDLSDFCEKLEKGLQAGSLTKTPAGGALADACKKVRDAIHNNVGSDACVIANQTGLNEHGGGDGNIHGISVYFPYSAQEDETAQSVRLLGEDQTGVVSIPLVKGGVGSNQNKGGLRTNQNKGGLRTNQNKNVVSEARIQRIQELESDFANLSSLFQETGWRDFTKEWSLILADRFPDKLDLHYSAQQSLKNLLSRTQEQAKELADKLDLHNSAQEFAKNLLSITPEQARELSLKGSGA
jgi:hypothetical protein